MMVTPLSRLALRIATLAALASLTAAVGCSSEQVSNEAADPDDDDAESTSSALSTPTATGPLEFGSACRAGTKITIAAVGDVLLHGSLQSQAYSADDGIRGLWKHVEPYLAQADLTYANLEGPCADGFSTSGATRDPGLRYDDNVYSGYPQFNYHPSLIGALKGSGVDVVSTANNHALDRRWRGADRTIENLNAGGLKYTGTRPSSEASAPWYTIVESKGVRVAFIACTFSTNGIPDSKSQVLHCYEDRTELLANIQALATNRAAVDAVIVTPHWGVEYNHTPESQEKRLAHAMIDAGAVAVFGNHPHVVQPWENYTTEDGREGFILYSLGNFVSGQTTLAKRSSIVLYLGLTKGADGTVTVNGARHLPLEMHSQPFTSELAAGDSLALTTRILGRWDRLAGDEPLVTNPRCQQ